MKMILISALFFGFAAHSSTLNLSCKDGSGNIAQVTMSPDVVDLYNKSPEEAVIKFTLNGKVKLKWKTAMYYALKVKNQYYVQFKDNHPTNPITGGWDFTFDDQFKPLTGGLSLQVHGEWSNYEMACSQI